MKRIRFTKISWKLTLIYSGIFSLVLILLNIATIFGVRFFLMRQAVNQVKDTGSMIIERIEELEGYLGELRNKDLVLEIPSNDNIYVKIFDQQGRMINESERYNQKIPGHIPIKLNTIGTFQGLLYETRTIHLKGHKYVYLQVVKSLVNENQFLETLAIAVLIADFCGIVFSLLSGLLISKKILTPITRITQTAKSISIYDLNQRIETQGPNDELNLLAKTFNEMISRLQDSFELQVRFVSDASHELRTPISVIQGYANLLDRWGKADQTVLQESIDVIKKETAHMAGMIEKLLFLARSDSGFYCLEKKPFLLSELVAEVVKATRLIATDFEIINQYNDPIAIYGDPELIKQMLRALLENSLKFSSQTRRIIVNLQAFHPVARITVQDFGIGIPPEDIPKIFNRFYQVDKAKYPGSGLGLSIVKGIVEAHTGEILVDSQPSQGTTFTVILSACLAPLPPNEKNRPNF